MAKKQIDRIVLINVMGHKRYEGNIEGKHFFLIGRNGSGKTTILQRIKRCLGMLVPAPDKLITEGEEDGKVGLYTSENGEKYYAEERITRLGKSRIYFFRQQGSKRDELKPAIQRLGELVGTPVDFTPLIDKDGFSQLEFFKNNLGLDLDNYQINRDKKFDGRTRVGQDRTKAKAKIESPDLTVSVKEIGEYKEKKNIAEILAKKKKPDDLLQKRKEIETFHTTRDNAVSEYERLALKEQELLKELADVQQKLESGKKWLEENLLKTKELEEIDLQIQQLEKDNAAVDTELVGVTEHNMKVDKVTAYLSNQREYEKHDQEYRDFTKDLNDLDKGMFEKIGQFKLSEIIPELELKYKMDEDNGKVTECGLFLNNLPFHRSQHSYGKLVIAIIKLSCHFNSGKLNFITIGDWNLLDQSNQNEVFDFVRAHPELHIQLGIEKVDNNTEIITELFEL